MKLYFIIIYCSCVWREKWVAYVFYLWQKRTFKVRNQTTQKLSKLQCTSQFCTPSECSVQLSTFLQLESFSFLLMLRFAPPRSMFNSWHVDPTISPQWTIGLIISRLYNLIISVCQPAESFHGLSWKTHGPISYMFGPMEKPNACQSSGAVWKSRWPSWAFRPNEPYGFCGRKATLNRASALVTICP